MTQTDSRFKWVDFYMEFADKLRSKNPTELLRLFGEAVREAGDTFNIDGLIAESSEIDPFSVYASFNRGTTDDKRINLLNELRGSLKLSSQVPRTFDGVPTVSAQKSWFFGRGVNRKDGDIPALWALFNTALEFSSDKSQTNNERFIAAYDVALGVHGVRWNLTMGLFWIRPWEFLALDENNRTYILNLIPGALKRSAPPKGSDYLALRERLVSAMTRRDVSFTSFPQLSVEAYGDDVPTPLPHTPLDVPAPDKQAYTVESIVADGCFLPRETLDKAFERLQSKKNLILQGPPGTGKTWLAKRLAYALIGYMSDEQVQPIQFHANMSYEDFVQGYRPGAESGLERVDGPFMELINDALNDEENDYVMVIEEINRGNPAQIFGEMLTLLEADKRDESEALALAYSRSDEGRVHIPENVYVIGTMNVADRSLALVDFALRRRFAFLDLEPNFGDLWHKWCLENFKPDKAFLDDIQQRMIALNKDIAADPSLGRQFCIGHSVVTPAPDTTMDAGWFESVVDTEIRPLLAEYWFDAGGAKTVNDQVATLTRDL